VLESRNGKKKLPRQPLLWRRIFHYSLRGGKVSFSLVFIVIITGEKNFVFMGKQWCVALGRLALTELQALSRRRVETFLILVVSRVIFRLDKVVAPMQV
jgi:hypothetical protein